MLKYTAAFLLAVLTGVGCGAERTVEQGAPSTPESRAAAGRESFLSYCAACHGTEARGDGPVASSLRTRPADLTRIAQRADGRFDAAAVAAYIDGRDAITEHGPSDMPVWGRSFDDRNSALTDETRLHPGTIFLIVEYLRTIQLAN